MAARKTLLYGYPGVSPLARQVQIKVQSVNDPQKKKLVLGFESLGATCEFGLVQRKYGAEPLDFFRWTLTRPRQVAACIDGTLDGVAEPDNVELFVPPTTGEFMLRDRRWHIAMHTFRYEGEIAQDVLHKQMCERLEFLRAKFLADLETGRRIYVFAWNELDVERAQILAEALRRRGPAKLLAVTLAGAPHAPAGQAGDVIPIDDHLCYGLLNRVGDQGPTHFNVDFDDWIGLCGKAARLLRPEGG